MESIEKTNGETIDLIEIDHDEDQLTSTHLPLIQLRIIAKGLGPGK